VFSPAVRLGAGMIVRKIFPESALCAVVLPHGAPAAFAEIGAPAFPIFFPGGVVRQALSLCRERGFCGILHGFLARQLAIFAIDLLIREGKSQVLSPFACRPWALPIDYRGQGGPV